MKSQIFLICTLLVFSCRVVDATDDPLNNSNVDDFANPPDEIPDLGTEPNSAITLNDLSAKNVSNEGFLTDTPTTMSPATVPTTITTTSDPALASTDHPSPAEPTSTEVPIPYNIIVDGDFEASGCPKLVHLSVWNLD